VPTERWPRPADGVRLDGLTFDPRPELHVTLVGSALGRELQATFGGSTVALVDVARNTLDWRFERSGRHLLLRKPVAGQGRGAVVHSIVELVDLPAMACFHRRLGRLLGRQLPVPPPHVTLYTAGRAQGIGISSPTRLRAFVVRAVAGKEVAGGQART